MSNLFNRVPKYQKIFQKTFSHICNDCGEFTYIQYEFCEKCGTKNSVRKAMIEDYTKYFLLKTEKEKPRSERILSDDQPENLKLLALLFTFFLVFLTFEIPFLINNLLIQIFPDLNMYAPGFNPDEIEFFINGVRPIGYICLIIIVIFIILGFLIKKEKISVSSSFLLFLPTFGSFASSMFFLAGIGILEVVWLPLDTPYFNFLMLGIIVYPVYLLYFLGPIGYIVIFILLILPWIFIILGLYIFTSGVISWFYGKYQKRDIIEFSIYKYSRHPQYLGFLIWSYGLFVNYMNSEFLLGISGHIGLNASLPWVIFALIIVGIAFLEDINLSKKYPDKYAEYRKRTPFLIKLPKTLNLIVSFPLRYILKKSFPETNKDILKVVILYGMIIIILSLLILLPIFFLF